MLIAKGEKDDELRQLPPDQLACVLEQPSGRIDCRHAPGRGDRRRRRRDRRRRPARRHGRRRVHGRADPPRARGRQGQSARAARQFAGRRSVRVGADPSRNRTDQDRRQAGRRVDGRRRASGGYWISMVADEIYAQPGTITGSIGISGMSVNVRRDAGEDRRAHRRRRHRPCSPARSTYVVRSIRRVGTLIQSGDHRRSALPAASTRRAASSRTRSTRSAPRPRSWSAARRSNAGSWTSSAVLDAAVAASAAERGDALAAPTGAARREKAAQRARAVHAGLQHHRGGAGNRRLHRVPGVPGKSALLRATPILRLSGCAFWKTSRRAGKPAVLRVLLLRSAPTCTATICTATPAVFSRRRPRSSSRSRRRPVRLR